MFLFLKAYYNELLNRYLGVKVDASKLKLAKTRQPLKFEGADLRGMRRTI